MTPPTATDILKHAGLGSPSAAAGTASGGDSTDSDDYALEAAMDEFQKHFTSGDKKKALAAFRALKDMC